MKKKLVSILMAAGVKDILSACCSCMNKRVNLWLTKFPHHVNISKRDISIRDTVKR